MAKTTTQLADKVLQKLHVIEAGASGSSNDRTIVTDAYASLYEELRDRHLLTWGYAENLPEWAVFHVRDILASRIANEFGQASDVNVEMLAFTRLAKHMAVDHGNNPVEAYYY